MQHHLEQQVAQLLAEGAVVAGVEHLADFFSEVVPQAAVVLLQIPRAAVPGVRRALTTATNSLKASAASSRSIVASRLEKPASLCPKVPSDAADNKRPMGPAFWEW